MPTPRASRPHMPGYGVLPASEGAGLLPWMWAEARLAASHDYWLATMHPDGRPNVTPVWGVWMVGALWFSCAPQSRKARNLACDSRCTVTTDDPYEPVIIEGVASAVSDADAVREFGSRADTKYETSYGADFFLENSTFRVEPVRAFGLDEDDFEGTPTKWVF